MAVMRVTVRNPLSETSIEFPVVKLEVTVDHGRASLHSSCKLSIAGRFMLTTCRVALTDYDRNLEGGELPVF